MPNGIKAIPASSVTCNDTFEKVHQVTLLVRDTLRPVKNETQEVSNGEKKARAIHTNQAE